METKIVELSCKTLLVDVSEYPLNFLIFPQRLTANAYVGCVHDCAYCYAKWYCKKDEVRVKVNAPEIFRKELQSRIKRNKLREPVCLGSISDPYQSAERKYQLTRGMLEVFYSWNQSPFCWICILRLQYIRRKRNNELFQNSWDYLATVSHGDITILRAQFSLFS